MLKIVCDCGCAAEAVCHGDPDKWVLEVDDPGWCFFGFAHEDTPIIHFRDYRHMAAWLATQEPTRVCWIPRGQKCMRREIPLSECYVCPHFGYSPTQKEQKA